MKGGDSRRMVQQRKKNCLQVGHRGNSETMREFVLFLIGNRIRAFDRYRNRRP